MYTCLSIYSFQLMRKTLAAKKTLVLGFLAIIELFGEKIRSLCMALGHLESVGSPMGGSAKEHKEICPPLPCSKTHSLLSEAY